MDDRSSSSLRPMMTRLRGRLGGDDIERLARGDFQAAALADGEMMHAGMLADDLAVGGDQFAGQLFLCAALAR